MFNILTKSNKKTVNFYIPTICVNLWPRSLNIWHFMYIYGLFYPNKIYTLYG